MEAILRVPLYLLLVLVLIPAATGASAILYVGNAGSNNITVIDTAMDSVIGDIPLGNGARLDSMSGLAFNPQYPVAYAATLPNLTIIDTRNHRVIGTIPPGGRYLSYAEIAVSDDGKRLYTANFVIDALSQRITGIFPPGQIPVGLALHPDGKRLYRAVDWGNGVDVLSTETNASLGKIDLGPNIQPWDVAVHPDGSRLYINTYLWFGDFFVVNTTTNAVEKSFRLGTAGTKMGMAITPDGGRLYVGSGPVINTTTNTVVDSLHWVRSGDSTGAPSQESRGPDVVALAMHPDGDRLYVTLASANKIAVFSTKTNTLLETVDVGKSPSALAISPSTVSPAPPPHITAVYQNTVAAGKEVTIRISVTEAGTSLPIPAEITLNLTDQSGKPAGSVSVFAQNYTYRFTPPLQNRYRLDISAQTRGGTDSYAGTIEVIDEEIQYAIRFADEMHTTADNEIGEACGLAAEKQVKYILDTGLDVAFSAKSGIVRGIMSPLAEKGASLRYFSSTEAAIQYVDGSQAVWTKFEEEIAKNNPISADIQEMGTQFMKGYYLSIPVNQGYFQEIALQDGDFKQTIQTDPRFSSVGTHYFQKVAYHTLARIYLQPLGSVVEGYWVPAPYIGSSLPMGVTARLYEEIAIRSTAFSWLLVIALAISLAVAIFFSDGLASVTIPTFVQAITVINVMSKSILLLIVLVLIASVPPVSDEVAFRHGDGINGLIEAAGGMQQEIPLVQSSDTLTHHPTRITAAGHVVVVSPSGRILQVLRESGSFTPQQPGPHRLVGLSHARGLFSGVTSSEFQVFRPNVTLEVSHEVNGMQASVSLHVCNREEIPVGNLTALLIVKNTTEGLVYADGEEILLDPAACRDLMHSLDFQEPDVYTATALVHQNILTPLHEVSFPLNAGLETTDDALIESIAYQDLYSPFENVTMNVTLLGLSPHVPLTVGVPRFGIQVPVEVQGKATVPLSLPVLEPGEYSVSVVAGQGDRILDSRIVVFSVRAEGTGIVSLIPDQTFWSATDPVTANVSVRDLANQPFDAAVRVSVTDPSGSSREIVPSPAGEDFRFSFTPSTPGTYLMDAIAVKPGFHLIGDHAEVIVGEMSRLAMNVTMDETYVLVRVTAAGAPTYSRIQFSSGTETRETVATDGIAFFNRTDSFEITAERPLFEPVRYRYDEAVPLPVASFSSNVTEGPYPLTVQFTDTSTGGDDRLWDFGDDTRSRNQSVVHTYLITGLYNVTLRVSNGAGVSETMGQIMVLEPPRPPDPPVANFTANATVGRIPVVVAFTDRSTGEGISAWRWDFGDTTSSWEQHPVHSYQDPGNYSVTLNVTGSGGQGILVRNNFITVLTPEPPLTPAEVDGPDDGYTEISYTYTTWTTDPDGDEIRYVFDWGDGTRNTTGFLSSGTNASLSHIWGKRGIYNVRAKAVDTRGAESSFSPSNFILIQPTNHAPAKPQLPVGPLAGDTNLSYRYEFSTTDPDGDPVQFILDWGDGSNTTTVFFGYETSIDCSIDWSHTWITEGTYAVKAKVFDSHGAQSDWSDSLMVTIRHPNSPPAVPDRPLGILSGQVGSPYSYRSGGTDPDNDFLRYRIDWGDGNRSETVQFRPGVPVGSSHQWDTPGSFPVRFRSIDEHGAESAWSDPFPVTISNQASGLVIATLPDTPVPLGSSVGQRWHAQGFRAIGNRVTGATVWVSRRGSPPMDLQVMIRTSSNPSTGQTRGQAGITPGQVGSDFTKVDLAFAPTVQVKEGGLYYLVLTTGTRTDADDFFLGYADGRAPYPDGIWYSQQHPGGDGKMDMVSAIQFDIPPNQPPDTPSLPEGPLEGLAGTQYLYTTSTRDPEGGKVRYTFEWGDGSTTTTEPIASGSTASAGHTWVIPGSYAVQVKARDEQNAPSGWSFPGTVTIVAGNPNHPPEMPGAPSGPVSLGVDALGTFSAFTSDPDGDTVMYILDWGDGDRSETGYVASGILATASHAWNITGSMAVTVMARDEHGVETAWSLPATVVITADASAPPETPSAPAGPVDLAPGIAGEYHVVASDPDGDDVACIFDWGDGTENGTPFQASGSTHAASHTWATPGTYPVRVKAKDAAGAESAWSTALSVVVNQPAGTLVIASDPNTRVYLGSSYSRRWHSQGFRATGARITGAVLAMGREGNPAMPLQVMIRTTPNPATGITRGQATLAPDRVGAGPVPVEVTFDTPVTVKEGGLYYLVVSTGTAYHSSNHYYGYADYRKPYPNGIWYYEQQPQGNGNLDMVATLRFG